MAIENRLEQLILEYSAEHGRRVTLRDLARATDLAESTLSRIASGKTTRIDYNTLDSLCTFFECQPGDLLIHVAEAEAA